MASKNRKRLPIRIETRVLTDSRRRCCLCYHLNGDLSVKKGQIAHIDHQRNNNIESNLAFLCFFHHDEYDSKKSQSKGITVAELRHAKKVLYEALQQQFHSESVCLRVTVEGDFDKLQPDERRTLLDKVLDFVSVKGEVRIVNVDRGSVRYTLEMTSEDAIKIYQAYEKGLLIQVGVLDVQYKSHEFRQVSFGKSYRNYSHGISKREASYVVLNADSMILLSDDLRSDEKSPQPGLYVKKITENYSILVITFMTSEIVAAYPINHNYVDLVKGENPVNVLVKFLEKFGVEMRLGSETSMLLIGKYITLPYNVSTDEECLKYFESFTKQNKENNELLAFMESTKIASHSVKIQIMFSVSKGRYYSSIRKLGKKFKQKRLGRYVQKQIRNI